jgi:Mg2+-importing ATPase
LDGLTTEQAKARQRFYGANLDRAPRRQLLPAAVVRRLVEPMSLVLLAAAVLSGLTGDRFSAGLILAILLLSIGLDTIQERQAMRAAELLRRSVAVRTRTRRDGTERMLEAEELTPGDVIRLGAGEIAPADALVLSSRGCLVDEASLTGEPYPVRKRAGPCAAVTPSDAYNALFRGAVLQSGEATALVTAVGRATVFGEAAAALADAPALSPFQKDLRSLGFLIVRLTGVLVLVVLAAHVLFGRPALQSLMFATALAVGLTPELLPMITTVTLARGAVRLSGLKVIVKRLASIHDLGAMTVLCTDKTGTLTEARIVLDRALDPAGAPSAEPGRWAALAAILGGDGGAIDTALATADGGGGGGGGWRMIDHAPFDFERRYGWVCAEDGEQRRMIVKGAPEAVLALCTQVWDGGDARSITDGDRARAAQTVHDLAVDGLRAIAVATRGEDGARPPSPGNLVYLGVCAFADPPKASAPATIARLRRSGIEVRILSGDHPEAVRRIAVMMGLRDAVLTGDEIARLTPAALGVRARAADAFARLTPNQKVRVVRALKDGGGVVGFLGDGINDAAAIKSADIGLSVEGAAAVAREAADMILLAPDLGVVAEGVAEGRRTFLNVLKYVRMGASSNFGNMLSMAAASLFLPFLPMLPTQILLNNLLYDLSEVGIPLDSAPQDEVARPQAWDLPALLRFTLLMGALSSVFDIATFWLLGWRTPASTAAFQTGWFMESMASQILVIFVIRVGGPFWKSRPHPALAASSLGALAVALALPFSPWSARLGFAPPRPFVLVMLGALVLIYLVLAEGLKRRAERPAVSPPSRPALRRRHRRPHGLAGVAGTARTPPPAS